MITVSSFISLINSFEGITELPHFEKRSFRYKNRILATLDESTKVACVKLDLVNQDVFSRYNPEAVYPVPNKWGKQGATFINLPKVKREILKDILQVAYAQLGEKTGKKK
jgi:hypothetical protein